MKLEINNKVNSFSIERLVDSTYTCDLCPECNKDQATIKIVFDSMDVKFIDLNVESYDYGYGQEVDGVEIKLCVSHQKIIAAFLII